MKHARRVGADTERVVSLLVRIALRANVFPIFKDAIMEAVQCASHYSLQLRIVGGTRALDYNVTLYHGALLLLVRQLCGALSVGLQLCATLTHLDGGDATALRDGDTVVLPFVMQHALQYRGVELGRVKQAGDSVATAVQTDLDVDDLVLDVAREAREAEMRALEDERVRDEQRREEEMLESQVSF